MRQRKEDKEHAHANTDAHSIGLSSRSEEDALLCCRYAAAQGSLSAWGLACGEAAMRTYLLKAGKWGKQPRPPVIHHITLAQRSKALRLPVIGNPRLERFLASCQLQACPDPETSVNPPLKQAALA